MPIQDAIRSATAEQMRDAWKDQVSQLVSHIESWAKTSAWVTRRIDVVLKEPPLPPYKVQGLVLQKDATRVLLEPIAGPGPEPENVGVVDLYRLPGMDDVARLYFENGDWQLHSRVTPDGEPLNFERFETVIEEMSRDVP